MLFNNKQGILGEETGELMVICQILQSFPLYSTWVGMILIDDFILQWLSTQASMQVWIRSASLYVLLNQFNEDKGLCSCLRPDVPFSYCCSAALIQFFSLTSSTTTKNCTKMKMCLRTTESHFMLNTLNATKLLWDKV